MAQSNQSRYFEVLSYMNYYIPEIGVLTLAVGGCVGVTGRALGNSHGLSVWMVDGKKKKIERMQGGEKDHRGSWGRCAQRFGGAWDCRPLEERAPFTD